jgi:hypothetical protein
MVAMHIIKTVVENSEDLSMPDNFPSASVNLRLIQDSHSHIAIFFWCRVIVHGPLVLLKFRQHA